MMNKKLMTHTFSFMLCSFLTAEIFFSTACTPVQPPTPATRSYFRVYNANQESIGNLKDLAPIWTAQNVSGSTYQVDPASSYIGVAIADTDFSDWAYILTTKPYNPTNLDADKQNTYGEIFSGFLQGRMTTPSTHMVDNDLVSLRKNTQENEVSPAYNLLIPFVQTEDRTRCLLKNSTASTDTSSTPDGANNFELFVDTNIYGGEFQNFNTAKKTDSTITDIDGSSPISYFVYKQFSFENIDDAKADTTLNPNGEYNNCIDLADKLGAIKKNADSNTPNLIVLKRAALIFPITIKKEENGESTDIATIALDTKYDDAINGFTALKSKLTDAGFIFPEGTLSNQ